MTELGQQALTFSETLQETGAGSPATTAHVGTILSKDTEAGECWPSQVGPQPLVGRERPP